MTEEQPTDPSGPDPDGRQDWSLAAAFLKANPTKWRSLSWIAARSLIASVNHVLSSRTSSLVPDLRQHWVGATTDDELRVRRTATTTRFLVAGDPGEQDGSQYVVAPALSRAAASPDVGFVLLLSDLIYPSGNVNDYVDGFYKPYRSEPGSGFRVDKPFFAIPGNHDWYDGLYGFAYHFLPHEGSGPAWPDLELAPRFDTPLSRWKTVLDRFARTMWRVPRHPSAATSGARAATEWAGQPAPYFVIETAHVELVCIDTGIDGTVDPQQMAWLERLSETSPKPKILMTGKPLMVNGEEKTSVVAEPGATRYRSINELVEDPASHYVATVGGDVHNFQLYDGGAATDQGRRLQHLVSGGGGAYTHPTHTIPAAVSDPRVVSSNASQPEDNLFPQPAESLSYFAQQLVPSVWMMFRTLLLFAGGVVLGWGITGADWSVDVAVGAIAGILLAVLLAARTMWPHDGGGGSVVKRALLGGEALLLGLLTSVFAYDRTPANFETLLLLYAGCTLWICVNSLGLRRTQWWSPVAKGSVPIRQHAGFFSGVLLLATAAVVVAVWEGRVHYVGLTCVVVYVATALGGWFFRVVDDPSTAERAASWLKRSVWVASAAQTLVVISAMHRVMADADLVVLFWSGFSGIALTILVAIATLVVPMASDLWALLFRGQGEARRRRAWRAASKRIRVVVFYVPPLLLAGWGLLADDEGEPWMKAALGLPLLLVVVIASALTVDVARQQLGKGYKAIPVAVLLAIGLLLVIDPGGLVTSWPVVTVVTAALAVVAIGASIVMAHLVFLGVPLLLLDVEAHRTADYQPPGDPADPLPFWSFISEKDANEIIRAERSRNTPAYAPADVSPRVRRRAEIAFPGLNPPFGPIQKFVAEIYSRDEPPFFKHFLEFDTDDLEVRVTIHRVRGDRPVVTGHMTTIPLPR